MSHGTLCTLSLVPAPVARGSLDLPPVVVPRSVPKVVPAIKDRNCPFGDEDPV